MPRAFLFFPNVSFSEPCLRVEDRGMWVEFQVPVKGKFVKVGTNADAGWAAYFTKGLALKSSVPWEAGQEYPEGGGTATLFNLGSRRDQGFCEVEHMGPLRPVAPGETAWLEQRIELIAGQGHRRRARERWVREWLGEPLDPEPGTRLPEARSRLCPSP